MGEEEVRELSLWAENDEPLYRRKEAFQANLIRKKASGTYDREKAVALWKYYAKVVKEDYLKHFSSSDSDFVFTKQDVDNYAIQLRNEFESEYSGTDIDHLKEKYTPKKYTKVKQHTRTI